MSLPQALTSAVTVAMRCVWAGLAADECVFGALVVATAAVAASTAGSTAALETVLGLASGIGDYGNRLGERRRRMSFQS